MAEKPTLKDCVAATGISKGYCHDILSGRQEPSTRAAVHIFMCTGWRHERIAALTPEQIEALSLVEPWTTKAACRAAA